MNGIAADQETAPAAEESAAGEEGSTPLLTLEGFSGPLERLLTLARAQQVDLGGLSLRDLVDQLNAALQQATPAMKLSQKADWVVMAAWLMLLRSRLLLPADTPIQLAAEAEADQLRDRLIALQDMQALAAWLDHRPQLGQDVFARGQPERLGTAVENAHQVDVVEFLWASLALFDDDPVPDTADVYRPLHLDLYTIDEARERILRLLAKTPEGVLLARLLPDSPVPDSLAAAGSESRQKLRRRSGWASSLIASLELAKQGKVVLGQAEDFQPIHVALT
jgi:segregation and condensation protein A